MNVGVLTREWRLKLGRDSSPVRAEIPWSGRDWSPVLRRFAIICAFLISASATAQEKPPIRLKMELMSIRNRSSGPLPVYVKLEYNKPQTLIGDLELQIYDAVDVISRDDLMASLRYEDITLSGQDYEFNIVLPPLKTAVTQNWAVVATFVTENERIKLTSLPNKIGSAEPFDLLTTSPLERGVLVCSCFKDSRRQSGSRYRQFLESALSLDNYNPIYAKIQAESEAQLQSKNQNLTSDQLSGAQKMELIGRTIIHFAGQWSSRDMPQDPLSYCAFDVVLLSDEALAGLQQEQLDGLLAWVKAGGSVCIVPDAPMKPMQLEFLRKVFAQGAENTADLSLDNEGRLLVISDESDPILMSHCGFGRAVLLPTIDDFATRFTKEAFGPVVGFLWKVRRDQPVWNGENWKSADLVALLKQRGINAEQDEEGLFTRDTQYQYYGYRQKDGKYYLDFNQMKSQFGIDNRIGPQAEPLLAMAEQALLPSDVEMVPTWIIGTILMGYVVAIGPGDYFLLGWLRLRKYTWILFPVITGVFTLLTVMVANAYMGSEDTGGKLVITDLVGNGIPARQTKLETLYYSAQANVENGHKNELVVLSEDNFSNLDYYNQYDRPRHAQDSPLSYSGHFPQNFSVRHRVQQWSPVSLRTLSLEPQESEVPPINWDDATLVTTPEGNVKLREIVNQYAKELQKRSTTPTQCTATIYHAGNIVNLVGQTSYQQPQRPSGQGFPYQQIYYHDQAGAATAMLSSIPIVKTNNENFFAVVSQVSPEGAGSLEDLAFLDSSDPSQWALVIAEQQGENFQVFRKLYVVK